MGVHPREIRYGDGDTELNGVLVAPDIGGSRPGILLIHGGSGLDDHAREQANRYAALGYTVFACDMFGAGVAGNRERVMSLLTTLRDDAAMLTRRARAGLNVLADQPDVDDRLGAVGFCFGGMSVLTLARSGADLRGVVSMHGSLKTAKRAERGAVRASILVCHGALDPHVPIQDVVGFVEEMDNADADYQVIVYSHAVHGFTHRHAAPGAIPGVEYNVETDRRSFEAARAFFDEAFGP